ALAEPMLEQQRWYGPQGLVWLPPHEEERLSGIDLPDARSHDHYHAVQVALLAHRRSAAGEVHRAMEREAPQHPMTIRAEHLLASYDADPAAMLKAANALAEEYPEAPSVRLGRLSLLLDFAPREESSRELAEVCRRFAGDPAVQLLSLRQLDG